MSDFQPINEPGTPSPELDAATATLTAAIAAANPPNSVVAGLRRPTTTDSSRFWHISARKWDDLLGELGEPDKKKVALNNLRKYDAAGRIMETDEGMTAPSPCTWCKGRSDREGRTIPCMVWKDKNEVACAYCKRMAKSGCRARAHVTHKHSTTEDEESGESAENASRLADLEERLATAVGMIEHQGATIVQLQETIEAQGAAIRQTTEAAREIGVLWQSLFPSP